MIFSILYKTAPTVVCVLFVLGGRTVKAWSTSGGYSEREYPPDWLITNPVGLFQSGIDFVNQFFDFIESGPIT